MPSPGLRFVIQRLENKNAQSPSVVQGMTMVKKKTAQNREALGRGKTRQEALFWPGFTHDTFSLFYRTPARVTDAPVLLPHLK